MPARAPPTFEGLKLILLMLLLCTGAAQSEPAGPSLRGCVAGSGVDQQRKCDQEASDQVNGASRITSLDGGWRLVRTKNPAGGIDAVSVMHVADSTKSDLDLAGLSLQCSHQGPEIVVITLQRMPRGSRPKVILTAGTRKVDLDAAVVQAGEALLLPRAAADLAAHEWQSSSELLVEIEGESTPIHGVIPIGGLATALKTLTANCPIR